MHKKFLSHKMKRKPKKQTKIKTFSLAAICCLSIIAFSPLPKNQTEYKQKQYLVISDEKTPKTQLPPKAAAQESTQSAKNLIPKGKNLKVPILTYHYISTPAPTDKDRQALSVSEVVFENQMKFLAENGYQTIALDDFYNAFFQNGQLPQKPIIITIDDGYYDAYINAYPILKKYSLKAAILLPVNLTETSNYLHWNQVLEMQNSGLITFVSHGKTHVWLPALDQSSLDDQIIGSKKILEEKLGIKINWFGYPYGAYDDRTIETVKKAGYLGAISTLPGSWQNQGEIFALRRTRIGNFATSQFSEILNQ